MVAALADLTIELATQLGKQCDQNRESPDVDDTAFGRLVWRVYLQTRNERVARAMGEQLARHGQ